MKGYQISQYDEPIAAQTAGSQSTWTVSASASGIARVHLEEDVAKLQHRQDAGGEGYSLVDVNRSGVPLMETVSEPDMRSPEEARQYLMNLRAILQYLGVSTGNMEDGSFRCDANVSIRPAGSNELFTRTEIKNMNSLRAVLSRAGVRGGAADESRRGRRSRGAGDSRLGGGARRDHASAHQGVRPRLPLLPGAGPAAVVGESGVGGWPLKTRLPELPGARRDRFVSEYGLSAYDAGLLTAAKNTADYFEESLGAGDLKHDSLPAKAKAIANWMMGDMAGLLNASGIEMEESLISARRLARASPT